MTLTPRAAMAIAVAMLTATLVWSRCETRAVPAAGIPLQRVPMTLGPWTCIKETANESYGVEVKTLDRTYRDAAGNEASVTLQGTYTRLGALRDWTLARTTAGWTVTSEVQRSLALAGAPEVAVMNVQELGDGKSKEIAVSWFASSRRQAATLTRAEIAAWGDRLAGRKLPWLSQYVTVSVARQQDTAAAQDRALDLARRVAEALRGIAAEQT